MKVCILFGSSSRTGYTYDLSKKAFGMYNPSYIMLGSKKINYFDYQNKYEDDDFIDCVKTMLNYDIICIASPVYWYSVSAQTKVFLDRLTDLVYFHTDLLDLIRLKSFAFLATYSTEKGFAIDITEKTLSYLQIKLIATLMVKNNQTDEEEIENFQEKCLDNFVEQKQKLDLI